MKHVGDILSIPANVRSDVAARAAVESGNAAPDYSAAGTLTQTIVTLTAGQSKQLVGANPNRKYLAWMNIGGNSCTVAPGSAAAVAGSGMNFDSGSDSSKQGNGREFSTYVPTGAFQAISTSGTTVIVWEGV